MNTLIEELDLVVEARRIASEPEGGSSDAPTFTDNSIITISWTITVSVSKGPYCPITLSCYGSFG